MVLFAQSFNRPTRPVKNDLRPRTQRWSTHSYHSRTARVYSSMNLTMRAGLLFTFFLLMVLMPTRVFPCPPVETTATIQVFAPCDGTIIHLIVVSPASFSSHFSFSVLLPFLACICPAWLHWTDFQLCHRTPKETFPPILLPPPRTLSPI